jgi:hypothetical protein
LPESCTPSAVRGESVKRYAAVGRFVGRFGHQQIVRVCSSK